MSAYSNRGDRLTQVRFTENKEEKLFFTEAGIRLMQGVRLIWGPLNTGFTVVCFLSNYPKRVERNRTHNRPLELVRFVAPFQTT